MKTFVVTSLLIICSGAFAHIDPTTQMDSNKEVVTAQSENVTHNNQEQEQVAFGVPCTPPAMMTPNGHCVIRWPRPGERTFFGGIRHMMSKKTKKKKQ